MVVFIGGNDIDSVYSSVYNGNANATRTIIERIGSDLETIIDFVLDDTPDMPMVLVNVPHVGATPEVKADHPPDPVKTARVSDALRNLDSDLRALADRKDIGYADILQLTLDLLPDEPYCIGGVPFINQGSDSGDPEFLWLGGDISQNFHPNTNGQAIVANAIIAGFNDRYGLGVAPLSESEIVTDVLGLQSPLSEWAESFGLPPDQRRPEDDPENDGLDNLLEFALALDPSKPSTLPSPEMSGDLLTYEYQLRKLACDHISTTPEWSTNLDEWLPVPSEEITDLGDQRFRISIVKTATSKCQFLRLKVELK